ncbi:MAG: glycosyltransferase 87 family protein [Mycobacteriaceae bacterium]|uniref:glycosyltransferase 87 family protein n=1 Tax=Corynebacterium sp. TaxID=1720 RepID=UPI003F9C3039
METDSTRPLRGRLVLTCALAAVLVVVAYRETRPFVFGRMLDLYKVPTDFMVYYRAGEAMATGGHLYDGALYGPLPFTYPPFAGTVFRALATAPPEMSASFWQLACVGALVAVILGSLVHLGYRLDTATIVLGVAATVATLALSPVRDSFFYGQINILLMLLVSLDFLRRRDRFTGIGVGIAAGLKLTPAFFILVFLMQRRWRDAATATATFIATIAIGLATVPDAWTFWTSAVFDSSRVGSDTVSASQSLKGFTERLFGDSTGGVILWAVLVCALLALLCIAVRWATRQGNQALVMSVGGVAACLVSPFSWHHHWVWLVPLAVCIVDAGQHAARSLHRRTSSRAAGWVTDQAVVLLSAAAVVVVMIPYCSHQLSYRFSFMGQPGLPVPLNHMWVLWGVLIVTAAAVPGITGLLRRRRGHEPPVRPLPDRAPRHGSGTPA